MVILRKSTNAKRQTHEQDTTPAAALRPHSNDGQSNVVDGGSTRKIIDYTTHTAPVASSTTSSSAGDASLDANTAKSTHHSLRAGLIAQCVVICVLVVLFIVLFVRRANRRKRQKRHVESCQENLLTVDEPQRPKAVFHRRRNAHVPNTHGYKYASESISASGNKLAETDTTSNSQKAVMQPRSVLSSQPKAHSNRSRSPLTINTQAAAALVEKQTDRSGRMLYTSPVASALLTESFDVRSISKKHDARKNSVASSKSNRKSFDWGRCKFDKEEEEAMWLSEMDESAEQNGVATNSHRRTASDSVAIPLTHMLRAGESSTSPLGCTMASGAHLSSLGQQSMPCTPTNYDRNGPELLLDPLEVCKSAPTLEEGVDVYHGRSVWLGNPFSTRPNTSSSTASSQSRFKVVSRPASKGNMETEIYDGHSVWLGVHSYRNPFSVRPDTSSSSASRRSGFTVISRPTSKGYAESDVSPLSSPISAGPFSPARSMSSMTTYSSVSSSAPFAKPSFSNSHGYGLHSSPVEVYTTNR